MSSEITLIKINSSVSLHTFQQWPQDWKRCFHFNPKERQCQRNVQTTAQLHSSHKLAEVMLKILQARLLQYVNRELPDVQAGFRKGRGTRDQTANIHWITKKARLPEKHLLLTVWITTNCGKFLKKWKYQITLPASWEICMQVKKQQLEPAKKQWTGSKLGKEYVKAVYCHPVYLTCKQSTSWEMPG